nr:hypothetical protein [Chloroflexia bacterium]
VQFHPEFRSRPTRPHPLFRDFVGAAKAALPEGAQRSLPLANGSGNGVAHEAEMVVSERMLAGAPE